MKEVLELQQLQEVELAAKPKIPKNPWTVLTVLIGASTVSYNCGG